MTAHKRESHRIVWPRVYRASGSWLAILVACGIILLLGGVAGIWFSLKPPISQASPRLFLILLCGAFAALGSYCTLSAIYSRVILFADRIEVLDIGRHRVMARTDIRGWRSRSASPPIFTLEARQPQTKNIKFSQTFPLDTDFSEWLLGLPHLDSEEARASKAEIRNDPNLGTTPAERMIYGERTTLKYPENFGDISKGA